MKKRNITTLIWLIAFLGLELGASVLGLEAIFAWLVLGAYTIALMGVFLFNAVKGKQPSALYPAGLIAFVIVVFLFTPLGMASVYLRLFVEENEYRKAIEAVVVGNNLPCEKLRCIVENMDKKQVAFVWGGITDNWFGICHDPTATVIKANILKDDWSNRNDPEYGLAAGMFEGTMIGAEHLWGDWYLCNFT